MKTYSFILSLILFVAFTACNDGDKKKTEHKDTANTAAVTPEPAPNPEPPAPPMDSATQAQKWMEYMTPGEMHKMLADMNGEWNVETTMWMDPAKPPMTSKGTMSNKMILGGRYQEGKHKGSMMGMPFEGISTTGYDNATKKFVSTWVDNMGSGVMKMEGDWDETSKTITLKGSMVDPITGKDCEMREVLKVIDKDNQQMEMYMTQDGKEYKTMESKISRKKG
jgi:hypothetical protein